MRGKHISMLRLTTFEKTKVDWVAELIADGANPLKTTYYHGAHDIMFTAKDLRNYHMTHKTPFFAVLGGNA